MLVLKGDGRERGRPGETGVVLSRLGAAMSGSLPRASRKNANHDQDKWTIYSVFAIGDAAQLAWPVIRAGNGGEVRTR